MSYPHKSGCQKRKERVQQEEMILKSQKVQSTLTAFKFVEKKTLFRVIRLLKRKIKYF